MTRALIMRLALLLVPNAFAQHHHRDPQPERPAELLEGLGSHAHPIQTTSDLAQNFFNQGIALIFGFNHDEAARQFAKAAELDPSSPMPHWGIAPALGPNYNLPAMPEREEKEQSKQQSGYRETVLQTSGLMSMHCQSVIRGIFPKTGRTSRLHTKTA